MGRQPRLMLLALAVAACCCCISSVRAATGGRAPARPVQATKITSLTDKDNKKKGMDHPAFANAGQVKGIEEWRIENFEPVPVPKGEYGKFYSGDSYIILNTKVDNKKEKTWDLHFWLGSKTSQDESGAAAFLTVALDDKLGGGPVQYRETQGHESPLFLGYFKPGIRYLDGGHASGFTHVTTNAGAEKRMFQVKGKKNIRVRQIEPSVASMNKGDCFILDVNHNIYVYVGSKAKRVEKLKAISAANQIRDQDHNGRSKIDIIDEFSSESDVEKFFQALGSGSRDTVPDESTGGDDEDFEKKDGSAVSLYRITDESGKMQAIPVSQKPFKQDQLNENDCYVLDTVTSGLYVWVGKGCNQKERQEVMKKAEEYMSAKNYPAWVRVTRVPQGTEPAAFKQYFATWKDVGMQHTRIIRSTSDEEMYSSDAEVATKARARVAKSGSARGFMPDHGEGHCVVYRVDTNTMKLVEVGDSEDLNKTDVGGAKYGEFYQGDSYVLKYQYNTPEGEQGYVVYFWLGADSDSAKKASALALALSMDKEIDATAAIRVPQGEETKHFLRIFQGQFVTVFGGHVSNFKPINQKDSYETDGIRLFKIHGNDLALDMRAEQVPEESSSVNQDDCFLLETLEEVFAWHGKDSSPEEKEASFKFSEKILNKQAKLIENGEDEAKFWEILGGAPEEVKESAVLQQRKRLRVGREPTLIQIQILSFGRIKLHEIGGYHQADLDGDDVFILDSGEEVYVWVGNEASQEEKSSVQAAVNKYMKSDPSDRKPDNTVIAMVKQGREPAIFKRLFDEWDDELYSKQDSYDQVKAKMLEQNEIL